jgi:hypothetical protein
MIIRDELKNSCAVLSYIAARDGVMQLFLGKEKKDSFRKLF